MLLFAGMFRCRFFRSAKNCTAIVELCEFWIASLKIYRNRNRSEKTIVRCQSFDFLRELVVDFPQDGMVDNR